jgi:hypothetical protein
MTHLIAVPFIHTHLLDGFIFVCALLNFLSLGLITSVLFGTVKAAAGLGIALSDRVWADPQRRLSVQ